MYRRRNKCCNCRPMYSCNNANMNISDDVLEDVCDNYELSDSYCCDDDKCGCGCGFDQGMQAFPDNAVLAQSYVPYQFMDKTFKPCVGLKMGTIFPELVSPYVPCQGIEEIEFIKATNKIGKGCNR